MRSEKDPSLTWQAQRAKWNDEGYCSRDACTDEHDHWKHLDTGLLYCRGCARQINRYSLTGEERVVPLAVNIDASDPS